MGRKNPERTYGPPFPNYTVGHCVGHRWRVTIRCASCGHMTDWGHEKLKTLDPRVTLHAIWSRAKCGSCGPAGVVVYVQQDHGAPKVAKGPGW